MKKIIVLITLFTCILSSSSIAFATDVKQSNVEMNEGAVIMVMAPDDRGVYHCYEGSEARVVYNKIQKENALSEILQRRELSEVNNDFVEDIDPINSSNKVMKKGSFSYKYRFIKTSSGTVYGKNRRITNILKNESSKTQKKTVSASTTEKYTIDTTLTGKYKEAFEASVSAEWSKSVSFSQELTINVAPKTKTWVEFQPINNYVRGNVEKYYKPRGSSKNKDIVVERKKVYSTSPRKITIELGGKTFKAPDGVYVWKEKKI